MNLRASLAFAVAAVLGVVACRQILGVEDLTIDGGAGSDGGADGASDSGGSGDAGDAGACRNAGTAAACFACCTAPLQQRGDFFLGAVRTCACQAELCQRACPTYCSPPSGADNSACDMCVLSVLQPGGACEDAGAGQTCAGCAAADECLRGCPQPAGGRPECGGSNRDECFTCCNGLYSQLDTFYTGAAQQCACSDAGGLCTNASGCTNYCGSPSSPELSCTECALRALTDGGPCAAVGEQSATCGTDCRSYLRCMSNCQRYFVR